MARWPQSISGGGGGGGGSNLPPYEYNQSSPSATWLIAHNLGIYPAVTVVDSGGSEIHGEVIYDSANQIRALFSTAFSGKAYLAR